jgi:hypothetical protein
MKTRRLAWIAALAPIPILVMTILGAAAELRFKNGVSSMNAMTRGIGVHFTNGRRSASRNCSISGDGDFTDDKVDLLADMLESWKYKDEVSQYAVDFTGTGVTGAGLAKMLRLPKIKRIYAAPPGISAEDLLRFKAQYPEPCSVFYKAGPPEPEGGGE